MRLLPRNTESIPVKVRKKPRASATVNLTLYCTAEPSITKQDRETNVTKIGTEATKLSLFAHYYPLYYYKTLLTDIKEDP